MHLSNHYTTLDLRRLDETRLERELELRRRIAEVAEAAEGVTDAARPRRGIRALLPRRFGRLVAPPASTG
ncbi:hypothetical protein [Agromyces sp. Marseille-P2726]|uniref:hypothetical protein n=1 Tax=Agromyces sp. Marseille-P2726 TaxID=2709132 RepID=UPI00156E6EE4|nr:hypothetical protein [Agromyces sp. Marseille-P2726]